MEHKTGTFYAQNGFKLFEQSWRIAAPKASVIIVHGYSEYSGRYTHVAEFMAAHGYDAFAFDQYGYGRSEGARAFPDSFDDHAQDIAHFARRVRQQTDKKLPVYMIAHSMGALLSLHALETLLVPIDGIVTTGAATRVGGNVPKPMQEVFKLMAKIKPEYRLHGDGGGEISRDPAVSVRFAADPHTYKAGIPLRTATEFGRVGPLVEQNIGRITLPILFMHGTADNIAAYEASEYMHKQVGSADKTLKLYDGLFHEILNEPEQTIIMGDIVAWLDERVAQHKTRHASHHQKRTKKKPVVDDGNLGKVG